MNTIFSYALRTLFSLTFCFVLLKDPADAIAGELIVGSTLDNLQAAYNGEMNAHSKYLAYAEKADSEGYKSIASLFRAAAKAEEIHANNHANVIKKLGAQPKADIQKNEAKSTLENLQDALAGESYERDVMYPQFIKVAEAEGKNDAVRTFNWALKAETGHANYYAAAIKDLPAWKESQKNFIVCPQCGFTTSDSDIKKCPVCSEPRKKFIEIKE